MLFEMMYLASHALHKYVLKCQVECYSDLSACVGYMCEDHGTAVLSIAGSMGDRFMTEGACDNL